MSGEQMTPEEVVAELQAVGVDKTTYTSEWLLAMLRYGRALKAAVEVTYQAKTFNSMDGCNAWSQACREILDAICREMSK